MPEKIVADGTVEVAIHSLSARAARGRMLPDGQAVTVRAGRLGRIVPGEIATILPERRWVFGGSVQLTGQIVSTRLDATALGLTPLGLEGRGEWDPADEYWGEPGEELPSWAVAVIACGRRPAFEMEQVIPGEDPDDPWEDPIIESNGRKDAGDYRGAAEILMALCQADLRCLDAHAHLGNLAFDRRPQDAIRHYEMGVRIGELSLPAGFGGVLLWGDIDNRPFLRCLHGYGLCLWRMGRFAESVAVFDRLLGMNPGDNQGVRFLVREARAGLAWRPDM